MYDVLGVLALVGLRLQSKGNNSALMINQHYKLCLLPCVIALKLNGVVVETHSKLSGGTNRQMLVHDTQRFSKKCRKLERKKLRVKCLTKQPKIQICFYR